MSPRAHVELSARAERDLRRLGPGQARERVVQVLREGLAALPPPANLDVKALEGAAPWLRLRVGDYRVVYRPLTASELATLLDRGGIEPAQAGFLVDRVVHRRDLERAVAGLP